MGTGRAAFAPDFPAKGRRRKGKKYLLGCPTPSRLRPPLTPSKFGIDLSTALAPTAALPTNALPKITAKCRGEPVPALGTSRPAPPLAAAKHFSAGGSPAPKSDLDAGGSPGSSVLATCTPHRLPASVSPQLDSEAISSQRICTGGQRRKRQSPVPSLGGTDRGLSSAAPGRKNKDLLCLLAPTVGPLLFFFLKEVYLLATRLHPVRNNALSDCAVGLWTSLKGFLSCRSRRWSIRALDGRGSTGLVISRGPAEGTSVPAPLGIAHLHHVHPEYLGKNRGAPFFSFCRAYLFL